MSTYNYEVGPRKEDFDSTLKRKEKEKKEKNRDKRSRQNWRGSKGDDGISVSVSDSRRVLWRAKKEESEAERRSVLSLTLAATSFSLGAGPWATRFLLSFFLSHSFFFLSFSLPFFVPLLLSPSLFLSLVPSPANGRLQKCEDWCRFVIASHSKLELSSFHDDIEWHRMIAFWLAPSAWLIEKRSSTESVAHKDRERECQIQWPRSRGVNKKNRESDE